jgi:TonB family protein
MHGMMRRLISFLTAILCSGVVFAETYESRSQKYALAIDVVTLGEEKVQYNVRVTDLETNRIFTFQPITSMPDKPAEARIDEGNLRLSVWLKPLPESLSADLKVTQGGTPSTLHTIWSTNPPVVLMNVEDALRVGGDIRPPVVLTRVEPAYTESARADRISGIIILEALVDKNGMVKEAIVLKDLPYGLGESALEAVRQWRFAPATRNGEPVDVLFNLTVNFKLR